MGNISVCDHKMIGKYRKISKISTGTFGKVILVENDNQRYAIKKINKKHRKIAEEEILNLKAIKDCYGVINYIENFETENNINIVTEFYSGIELFDFIEDNKPIPEETCKYIFRELCKIVKNIHKINIVHRDIKPENIILCSDNNQDFPKIILIDWGLAFDYKNTTERKSCGSVNYAAPEVYCDTYVGPEIDVWSMGATLYALLTAKLAFDGRNYTEIIENIKNCNVDYDSRGLTDQSIDLLKKIFVLSDRISVDDILNHRWLSS